MNVSLDDLPRHSHGSPDSLPDAPPESQEQTLRRLFLTLFLRGRSSRGLKKDKAPRSIGEKLAGTLGLYMLLGFLVVVMMRLPTFALSVYLHAMTFAFLGIFLASSIGEILFNKEEADILLHRPVAPGTLLWAKIRVLLEVSLWMAVAFNLGGFFVGCNTPDGSWRFLPAHVVSVGMQAVFCAGCVVMIYQLCFRWFGRERLEGLITTAQVLLSVGAVLCSQILPQLVIRTNSVVTFGRQTWWMALLPPAWFAGVDDAIAGTMAISSWLLAAMAVVATGLVVWVAFGKLAVDYETGQQKLSETVSTRKRKHGSRRWIDVLVDLPLFRWWLRDPVARASFLLTAAYLMRDRDVKLRVYPAIAPMMALPVVFLVQGLTQEGRGSSGFGIAFSSSYLGIVPMLGLSLLQYSQQWQATDIFRAAPLVGPASLCHGARRAVLVFLALPTLLFFGLMSWAIQRDASQMVMLLPGIVALPIYALIPSLTGNGVPLSLPTEEAKGAGRGLSMIGVMLISLAISGLAIWSRAGDWFWWLIVVETVLSIAVYVGLRRSFRWLRWRSME
jgi:hypothetical protein